MEVELIHWNPGFAKSSVEKSAEKTGGQPSFSCSLPATWVRSWEKFHDFNSSKYITPYAETRDLMDESLEMEKRTVALVHELLSLTLWKRISILKLSHFRREFSLPYNLNVLLLKHPGIFYVTNKYQIYTVVLREAYNGSELVEKDPLVVVKEKYGELMQHGLHEYNRRNHVMNLEKKKKKKNKDVAVAVSHDMMTSSSDEICEQDDQESDLGGILDPEERKRFYKVLFSDDSK